MYDFGASAMTFYCIVEYTKLVNFVFCRIDVSGYHVIPGSTLVLLDVLPMSGIIDCRACFCLNFELLVSVGLVFLSVRCIVINMGQIGNLCTS